MKIFHGISAHAERSTDPELEQEGAYRHPGCVEHPRARWLVTECAGGQQQAELILPTVTATMDGSIPKTPGPVLHNQSHSLCLPLSHSLPPN